MPFADFLRQLAQQGRHHFTTEEAVASHGGSPVATRAALRRLKQKGEIATPCRGFHVLVPPDYHSLGCLPPEQFVPHLMRHLGEPYYVALLSAAEIHGAAPQRPQVFQVMVKTNRRAITCGQVRVQFVARKDLERTPTVERNTPRGTLRVASPEATALELVGHADHCGGLDHVAAVLADLAESLDPVRLVAAAATCPIAWAQRLGYLLDLVGHRAASDGLAPLVQERAGGLAALVRAGTRRGASRVDRWRLVVNATVEPDL
ncbi:MAG: hypothetical protein FJ265_11700 [Planctomycetes bacterium]|nr:hypothetical protein [Planctomycetota bacterium]